jgi:hypothetical protein
MTRNTHLTLCTTCGQDFGGTKAFDKHRVGKHEYLYDPEHPDGRRCLTHGEMVKRGMYVNARDRWSQAPNGLSERLGLAQEATRDQADVIARTN